MNWNDEFDNINNELEYKIESVNLQVIELILNEMEKNNWNSTDLSKQLNISKPAVSKLLAGKENLSLKRMVTIFSKLNIDLSISKVKDAYTNILVKDDIIEKLRHKDCVDSYSVEKISDSVNFIICTYLNDVTLGKYLNNYNFHELFHGEVEEEKSDEMALAG